MRSNIINLYQSNELIIVIDILTKQILTSLGIDCPHLGNFHLSWSATPTCVLYWATRAQIKAAQCYVKISPFTKRRLYSFEFLLDFIDFIFNIQTFRRFSSDRWLITFQYILRAGNRVVRDKWLKQKFY